MRQRLPTSAGKGSSPNMVHLGWDGDKSASGKERRSPMARSVATLPAGSRLPDYISPGVIAKCFPLSRVKALWAATTREPPPARSAGTGCHVLRHCAGALHGVVLSRGAALSVGRRAVAVWSFHQDQGCRQVRDLSGAHAPGLGGGAPTA